MDIWVCLTCLAKSNIQHDPRCLESQECGVCRVPDHCIKLDIITYSALAFSAEEEKDGEEHRCAEAGA